ncbi:hypothetical protein H2O73_13985 [Vibrio sp. 404]|uniref:Uncharacterized protein n=1 Tax=Vibrio marinisediminis TaxID=2758441 RepID=A0A7W2FSI0_9VIBR|nr:hypothetical protein [Vibrio marinisediminis]MBA5763469.1 hypothetical protein [Vibrio marinisediminis]
MAAQKLTKGRFVQIIIMLTLLIVAFFWRTMTYNEVVRVNCVGQTECNFDVNGSQFTATINGKMLEIRTSEMNWILQGSEATSESNQLWKLAAQNIHSMTLENKKTKQTYTIELTAK